MTVEQSEEVHTASPIPLAPAWHTALLVGVILAVAITGSLLAAGGKPAGGSVSAAPGSPIVAIYLPTFVVQCLLAVYVCRFGRERNALGALVGERWPTARRALGDIGIAFAVWILIEGTEVAWSVVSGGGTSASVARMLPASGAERAAWGVVAIAVGISEELVYRGYLRVQLSAWLRNGPVAVLLQGALFGVAHLEQGAGVATRIAMYGIMLGVVATWRRSLVAGILCHVWTDLASGLLPR